VEAAAWLHDIGYAPDLAVTGLHALDGAGTRATPNTPTPCCAVVEADERGLADVWAQRHLAYFDHACDLGFYGVGEPDGRGCPAG
jgi:hypothetical protein